jgi:hypothetical protein
VPPGAECGTVSDRALESYQREAHLEAAPFVLLAACFDIALALLSLERHWQLAGHEDWWVWLVLAVPALVLVVVFGIGFGRIGIASDDRRRVAILLLFLLMVANVVAIGLVIGSLLGGSAVSAGQLLASATVVLAVDTIVFGLAFWELDCGGPVHRAKTERRRPDFQFPQDENPELAAVGWKPHLPDYVYVALTNSIAFSPTDTMPLTQKAKLLMGIEATVAAVTVLVVAARAVNVLS